MEVPVVNGWREVGVRVAVQLHGRGSGPSPSMRERASLPSSDSGPSAPVVCPDV